MMAPMTLKAMLGTKTESTACEADWIPACIMIAEVKGRQLDEIVS
jgi:hypothetical protein